MLNGFNISIRVEETERSSLRWKSLSHLGTRQGTRHDWLMTTRFATAEKAAGVSSNSSCHVDFSRWSDFVFIFAAQPLQDSKRSRYLLLKG